MDSHTRSASCKLIHKSSIKLCLLKKFKYKVVGLPCVGDCLVFQRMLTTVSRDFHPPEQEHYYFFPAKSGWIPSHK